MLLFLSGLLFMAEDGEEMNVGFFMFCINVCYVKRIILFRDKCVI